MLRLTGFLSIIFLTGCATLSQEECVRADWFALGANDGHAGQPISRLSEHATACSDYGITVNDPAYLAGREQGLQAYCQLNNAFETGLNGQTYYHVCPPPVDVLFRRYHAAAFAVHEDRYNLERLDDELSSKESQLRDKKLADDKRAKIRDDIRDLDRKRDRLRDDFYYHQRQLDDLRQEARSYR